MRSTIHECLADAPGGLTPRALALAVSARLGVGPEQMAGDELAVALGLAIVAGEVDEREGRLVLVRGRARGARPALTSAGSPPPPGTVPRRRAA